MIAALSSDDNIPKQRQIIPFGCRSELGHGRVENWIGRPKRVEVASGVDHEIAWTKHYGRNTWYCGNLVDILDAFDTFHLWDDDSVVVICVDVEGITGVQRLVVLLQRYQLDYSLALYNVHHHLQFQG